MAALILPLNACTLTASWKTAAYNQRFGFAHYGVDMVSAAGNYIVYASGNGVGVACGYDNVVGNVVAVKYFDGLHRPTGRSWDVCSPTSIVLHQVQPAREYKDTVLGYYGNTGMVQMANHLHVEADLDTN
jgi:murein DD-endopeptidase MepM/ murein hydrolase activator NlpD